MKIPHTFTKVALIAAIFLVFVAAFFSASDQVFSKASSGQSMSQSSPLASIDGSQRTSVRPKGGTSVFAAAAQKEQARMLRAFDFSSAGAMDLLSGVHKMKSATEPPADLNAYAKYLNPGAANANSMMFMATPTDFPAGSYIINMGITPQTVANGLKPYGLIFALIKTHKVPVYWAIKSGKVAYDEIDFSLNPGTPNVVRDYKSGAFIIPGNFITASVLTTINTWKATGVVVDGPTPAITGIPVYDNITYFPNSVLNNENTAISTGFYGDAGIPASAYSLKLPAALTSCDDLFIMPHADPTWATHQNLIAWNNIGGYIWAGCHAVSVFEDLDEPIEAGLFPNMNFLTTLGLAHYQGDYPTGTNGGYNNHEDGSYPATGYTYDTSLVSEPIMQILYNNGNAALNQKGMDGAQENGSEQIYLPLVFNTSSVGQVTSAWRPTTKVAIYDPTQQNVTGAGGKQILSNGLAAKLAYGPGFGGVNNGIVMYQGSHDIGSNGTIPARVQAERAFFNFVLMSGINQRPSITLGGIPPVFIPGQSYAFTTTVTGGNPAFTYAWTSSCGGSFSPSASNPNPTFTAPLTGTGCNILVTVTDACLRANFAFTYPEIPLQATADLAITKTNGVTTVNAGSTTNVYTLVVTNNGPSAAGGATISDPAATGLNKTAVACTATTGGAVCPTAGGGAGQLNIANLQGGTVAIPTLPSGSTVTFTVTTTVTATLGSVTNTATVTEPAGVTDTNTANNTASDTDPVTPVSDLVIVKTDGVLSVNAGGSTTYTITVTNNGPSSVTGAILNDPLVANLTKTLVACSGTPGVCVVPPSVVQLESGSFMLPTLASGQTYQITVTATVANGATGSVANAASVAPPVGTLNPGTSCTASGAPNARTFVGGVCTSTDTDTVNLLADLAVTKDDGVTSVNAGGSTTYTVTLTNNGPSAANGSTISDPAATGLTKTAIGVCTAAGGAVCPTAGAGAGQLNITNLQAGTVVVPTLPSGGSISFTITATVTATTGSVTNTFSATPPVGTTDSNGATASDTDTVTPVTDLAITKTDGSATYTAGNAITYTIVVSNSGPSNAVGASVADTIPAAITGTTINCAVTGTASCGTNASAGNNLSFTGVNINSGAGNFITITVSGTVNPSTTGNLVNTATVSVGAGQLDLNTANNSATDTDTPAPIANLVVTKSDGVTSVNAGASTTYTVTLTNNGPSAANGSTISDPVATGLTKTAIGACTAGGGAVCPTAGAGAGQLNITNLEAGTVVVPTLPVGGSLSFTITATVTATSGSVTNTFSAAPPAGTVDPSPASASDTDTVNPIADLAVTKDDGVTSVNAGGSTTYTVTLTNNGPSAANGSTISDPAATGLTKTAIGICTAAAGAVCPTAGAGAGQLNITNLQAGTVVVPTLPSGGSISFTITATVTATTGSVTNTFSATAGGGATDLTPGNNSASDTDTVTPVTDLAITKTDGAATYTAGNPITYTIMVSNSGPSNAVGASVADTIPAAITGTTIGCVVTGTASCGTNASVGNNLSFTGVNINSGAGNFITITVSGIINPSTTGNLVNTATVSVGAGQVDLTPGNNSATDTDTPNPIADLAVQKNGPATVAANGTVVYTIRVSNAGPSAANGAAVTDPFPGVLSGVTWVCNAATGGATCGAPAGVGNLNTTVALFPPGGSVTYTVTGTAPAAGTFVNTATVAPPQGVTDPNPTNNNSSVTTGVGTVPTTADLAVIKTGPSTVAPGGIVTYKMVVTNAGPGAANGATVTDNVPLAGVSWTCGSETAGASCGVAAGAGSSINTTIAVLPAGASVTFTVTGTAPGSGLLTNTVNVAPPGGVTDPNLANNTSSVQTNVAPPTTNADLYAVKTGPATVGPFGTVTYKVIVGNSGPDNVTNAFFTDNVPSVLTSVTWTCGNPTDGAICGTPAGVGNNISTTVSSLPTGSTVTFTITGTAPGSGSFVNSALITPPPGTNDPDPSNNIGGPVITNIVVVADLAITKTDGSGSYTPGSPVVYTIVVSNAGPDTLTGAVVADNIPTQVTSWVWACSGSTGGASGCTAAASNSSNFTDTIDLPSGSSITYTVTAQISPLATGDLVNTATVTNPPGTTDPTPGNNSATDTDMSVPVTDLVISKTDGSATYTAGNAISYTIVVSNNGPSSAIGASVADTVPASITGLTIGCVANGSASCGVNGSAGNNVSFTGVNITAGAGNFITITVSGTINPNTTGNLVNTATVTAGAGQVDLTPGNNSATDTDTPNPIADLAVQKNGPVTVGPNGTVVYTIRVSNAGPSAANGASVTDPFPGALSSVTWVCNATTGGATCGVPAGSGNINTTVALFPPGGSVTYTVTGTAPVAGTFDNTATVAPPQGVTDPNSSNNNSTVTTGVGPTPTTADLAVIKSGPSTVTASGSLTYTIVVTNAGPGAANGATVMDTVPAGVTGVTWTCGNATAGAVCGSPNGAGNVINTTVSTFPAGASVTFTVMGTAPASGTFTNTVNVATPGGVTDPNPANNTSSVTTTVQNSPTVADLYAVKTGPSTVGPNAAITYKVIVGNSGPAGVTNAPFSDIVPAAVTGVTWTCGSPTAGASCGTPSGSGNAISFNIASLPAGSMVTLTITGTGPSSGSFVNSAMIQPPPGVTDPDPTDNIGGPVITNVVVVADLSITKTDNSNTYTPGAPVTYTIVVTNNGPDAMAGVVVADNKPAQVTQWTWVCSGTTGGATGCDGVINSMANFSDTVDLPSGATITYTVTATIPPSATGNLVNTATVTNPPGTTDPNPGNNSATDTDTPAPAADLSIVKDDGSLTYTPGGSTTYAIVVTNNGPSNVANVPVTDTFPAAITSATWTCVASPGSSCIVPNGSGNIGTFVNLVSGGVATFQVTAQISPNAIGNLVNTAIVGVPQGVVDPNPVNNSSTDTDTPTPMADLLISKTDNAATYTAGTSTTYTIVVTNNGPSGVSNAAVMDNLPAGITSATWSCVASIGGNCDASFGVGNINTTVDLAPGATATFTLIAQISPSATGNLVNTATIAPPQGTTDPIPNNNSSTDTDTPAPVADLAINKTDNSATYTPGGQTTYLITVSNSGPSAVVNAPVNDTLINPAFITSATWTCVASAGSSCGAANGAGNIASTVSLLPGGTAIYTVTAQINPAAVGTLVNTATVTPPQGPPVTNDPNPGNNSSTDTDTPAPVADLSVTKTDGSTVYTAGTNAVYTMVVSNNGPSNITNATVTDTLPAGQVNVAGASWTCLATAGSFCIPGGSGNIATTVNLIVGGSATFTYTVPVLAGSTGNLTNTVTVAPPNGATDPNPNNNTATDTDMPFPQADLGILKTGPATYTPGATVVYTIVATNNGPSTINGGTVTDLFPAAITAASWTCNASAGSSCTLPNGNGNINTTVNLLPAGTATFSVTAQINPTATGNLVNTATVTTPQGTTDVVPGNNSSTWTSTPAPSADLRIAKTDGSATYVPGGSTTYTIVATNDGPSAVTGATISDSLPVGATSGAWTCVASAGSTCTAANGVGAINTTVNLLPTGTATFTLTVQIASSATGNLVNTATVTVPQGTTDPNPGNNTAIDTDTPAPQADLSITKTDGQTTAVPGQTVTYTIVATNNGPSDVTNATVVDTLPATLSGATWTCAASVSSSCSAPNGVGNINTTVTLVKGGTATFSLTATISASATGSLTNTATVAPPAGTTDPTPGNNTATDTDTLTPQADLAMSKTDNSATYIPGSTVIYTIVATNNGPSVATNALITDTLPASITSATWTCVASAGSSCTANGTGSINATATLLVNGTATFTLTAQVSPNATGNLVNTANVAPPQGTTDPNPGNNSATDTDTPNPQADLTINKTDGVSSYTAGLSTTYTILVTNTGPSSVNNAAVVDTLPAGITSATWSCVASVNGNCDAANGSGNINTTVDLAPGATATFTVVAQISSTATGNLVNTATVAPPAGTNDPNQQNNSSTDTDTPAPRADLAITKTDGVTTATPGGQTVYTIVATNNGPSAATDVNITDNFPAAITSATWTCTSAGGAICPNANGTGNINQTADLPLGSSLTYTVTANISPNATGQLINTAIVDFDSEIFTDPNPSNNTATDIDTLGPAADIVVQKNGTGIVQINGAVNYTIEIKNLGPSSANGTTFSDTLPAGLGSPAAICTSALAGAVCPGVLNVGGGTVTGTIPTLPPGGNLVITITGTAPGTIGSMTNVATATPPQGVTDPNPGNNTSAAMTQVINTPVPPVANLAVVKVGPGTVQTNGTITYYVTVNNAGPGAANGASFTDTVPAAITNVSWTCQSAGGAVCPNNNGVGNTIAQTIATFPANGQLVYTIIGTAPQSAQSLTNTATITTPPGVTDPDPSDNTSSTPTTVQTPPPTSADLVIAKTGPANVAPNGQMTYTLVVTNKGPAAADGALVSDNIPDVLTNVTATCSASSGAVCGATTVGAGNVLTGVISKMPVWGIVTYTITATAPQSGSFTNSATVTPPPGVTDPDPGSNTGGPVVTTVGPTLADLAITKTNNASTVVAGTITTYVVVVTNNGPAAVTNAAVNDNLPASLVNATWTCQATSGSSCTSAAGNGSINTNVSLLSGGQATFIVSALVLPTATGTLSNTATVTAPPGVTDPNLTNNTATDGLDVIQSVADLSILKTDNTGVYTPGGQTTYTIVVTNNGPSAVANAAVADTLPASITSATWTCSATVGSACGAALGNGSIASTVSLLPGGQAVYTVHALISPSATGNLVNTATVTPPNGVTDPNANNNSSTDTDTPNAVADLVLSKTNNALWVTPGGQTTYVIKVTNNGPSSVTGATVNDTLPAYLSNATWSCAATAGSSCGVPNGTGSITTTVNLLPGGMATFTLTATVAVGQTADVVNTAAVTPPPGVTDPNLTNNTQTDIDKVQPVADLAITKTNSVSTLVPGTSTTYQIVVTNNGPSSVTNAQVVDLLPPGIASATWNCGASGGSSCGAPGGTGSINTTVSLLPSGTATFTVVAQVSPTAKGILTNTATVIPPQGTIDPNTSNNSATDSDPLTPQGNISITKTNGVTSVTTGGTTTYTIVASNSGPSAAIGAQVADIVPAFLTNVTWTCVASAGSSCGLPNGSGSIGTFVNLAAGGTATFTLTGTVTANASGQLVNTAIITPPNGFTDTNPNDNSSTDTDTIIQQADLTILKTNFVSQLASGGQTQYTILVTNLGPSNVTGATVADTLPATLTNATWTCVASAGSSCAATNGAGNISTTVNLLAGGTATFLLNATVSPSATGTIANTANVTPPNGVTDPTPNNNSSTDTDQVITSADLSITKTVNVQTVPPGGPLSYVITVRNTGPSNITGAAVADTFSAKLTDVTWSCSASSGSSCGTANGTGNIATTVDLLVNGSAVFVVTAKAAANATGTIENFASVQPPNGSTDPNPINNITPPVVVVIVPGVDLAIYKSHTDLFQVGQISTYKISVENVSQFPTSGTITVTDTLPKGLIYQSVTGQGWTCNAVGQVVTCTRNAPMQSGVISDIFIKVLVDCAAYPSVINTVTVSTPGDLTTANNTATDPTTVENGQAVGGGQCYPPESPISDQKAGSILIYPIYTSDPANPHSQNTRINLTNTDPSRSVGVHLFFIDGTSCSVSDFTICLTAQQTTTFLASDIDPGVTGYVIAVAVNNEGCPILFNQLIGDEYVKFTSGHKANLGAEAISALPGLLTTKCNLNSGAITLNFDGTMYNQIPRVLAVDNITSKGDGNDIMLIVDRIGGNLATGTSTVGTLFGLLYDDLEVGASFTISGNCQLRNSLSNNFPRTAPRFEQHIPAGRTGWMKIYSQSEGVGIVGSSILFNPNASSNTGAFNQGHNLHKLTLTNTTTLTLPVYPFICQ